MLKKLTDEKLAEILEAGIAEFAEHGMRNTNMSAIAKKAGISVGVLYKYYEDKDSFFSACLGRSLAALEKIIASNTAKKDKPLEYAEALITAVQTFSKQNAHYVRMYHEITTSGNAQEAELMASRIEGLTSRIYTEIVARAQNSGDIRNDLSPSTIAMFMDNLLMMIQFSYCCPYYSERYRLYQGRNIGDDDEELKKQLVLFLKSAFEAR